MAEPDLTIASDLQRKAIMCQRETDEMLFGDENTAAPKSEQLSIPLNELPRLNSTPKPDPEVQEQPEIVFRDFPEKSTSEVVSIDDKDSDDSYGNMGCRVFKGGI